MDGEAGSPVGIDEVKSRTSRGTATSRSEGDTGGIAVWSAGFGPKVIRVRKSVRPGFDRRGNRTDCEQSQKNMSLHLESILSNSVRFAIFLFRRRKRKSDAKVSHECNTAGCIKL